MFVETKSQRREFVADRSEGAGEIQGSLQAPLLKDQHHVATGNSRELANPSVLHVLAERWRRARLLPPNDPYKNPEGCPTLHHSVTTACTGFPEQKNQTKARQLQN